DAVAALEALGHPAVGPRGGGHALERAEQARRALLVRETCGVRRRQRVASAFVRDVAGRGLRVQPLADVALVGARALRELRGGRRPIDERLVEPELVADHDERSGERTVDVAERLLCERLDRGGRDLDVLSMCGGDVHGTPFRRAGATLQVADGYL